MRALVCDDKNCVMMFQASKGVMILFRFGASKKRNTWNYYALACSFHVLKYLVLKRAELLHIIFLLNLPKHALHSLQVVEGGLCANMWQVKVVISASLHPCKLGRPWFKHPVAQLHRILFPKNLIISFHHTDVVAHASARSS